MAKITEICDSLRRIIGRWTITTTTITADAQSGDTILTVDNSIRFGVGDELIIRDAAENTEPLPGINYVASIPDENHIELVNPLVLDWPVSATPSLFKSIGGQYVKAIYIGEPAVIEQYPAITVNGTGRNNTEWLTMRGTLQKWDIEITVYVEDATVEGGYRLMDELSSIIEEGLKKNIYPLVNNYDLCAVTVDTLPGDTVIKVADSSIFNCNQRILIEDKYTDLESMVTQIIDPTTIRIYSGANYPFKVANNAVAISPKRFIHNSWPSSTKYGSISKGTLLKAATISYFADEYELEFRTPWPDTQIT
jgi:hypothetical protein